MSEIGDSIKKARKSRRISQVELAKRSGISQSGISDIENLQRNPSVETVGLIAQALGMSVSELLNEQKETAAEPGDSLKREAIFLLDGLSPAAQEQALSYLRYLSDSGDRK